MKVNNEGKNHLKKVEGFRNNVYLDSAGVPTIGYGFTYYPCGTKVKTTDAPISRNDADVILLQIMEEYEDGVNKYVTSKLTQNQFNALVSFSYNVGVPEFRDSTLLKKVNRNPNDTSIEAEFLKWKYSGGRVVKGLIKRRNMEYYLYSS